MLLPVPRSADPFIAIRRRIVGDDGVYLTISCTTRPPVTTTRGTTPTPTTRL